MSPYTLVDATDTRRERNADKLTCEVDEIVGMFTKDRSCLRVRLSSGSDVLPQRDVNALAAENPDCTAPLIRPNWAFALRGPAASRIQRSRVFNSNRFSVRSPILRSYITDLDRRKLQRS